MTWVFFGWKITLYSLNYTLFYTYFPKLRELTLTPPKAITHVTFSSLNYENEHFSPKLLPF